VSVVAPGRPVPPGEAPVIAIPQGEVYRRLDSSRRGLTAAEAARRLEIYGPNQLAEAGKTPLLLRFLGNFYQVFALLLWASAALAFFSGSAELGWAIIFVIVVNAVFSFYQEYQAERAIEALKEMLPARARVLRDGEEMTILARDLVPGDVMVLEEGDNVSADGRLVEAFELRAIHASLTGESAPVPRSAEAVPATTPILEAPNVVFAGTTVAHGRGTAVVFATGMRTEFGRIAGLTQRVKAEPSPLAQQIQRVAYVIAGLAVGLGFVLFLVGLAVAHLSPQASVTFAIGMITANVPEGLLPTVTLALAVAVRSLARQNALVRKLAAVETLGSTTVIATDKTGTLTQNAMNVRAIALGETLVDVTGVGYEPRGKFLVGSELIQPLERPQLRLLIRTAAFCSNARLIPPEPPRARWTIVGDPTEGALLTMARKAGFDLAAELDAAPRIYELPFDSIRKRMSTIHREGPGLVAYVKGSPTGVLDLCSRSLVDGQEVEMTPALRQAWVERNDALAGQALRVLGFAYRRLPPGVDYHESNQVETDLVFVGLAGMMDPPRPEVAQAIALCHQAGIRVIMVTGDYGLTAVAIAVKIGLVSGPGARIVSGPELERLADEQLQRVVEERDLIFARVSPEHKLRIARALEGRGEVVAMTGDGVNDAPALKRADIGVAMGITGTDAAKEAAQMVLADDNFATIVKAVELGRAVFDNIRKFIVYIFAHLGPEAVPFIFFALFPVPLALTALVILAIDLGTETLPALALGMEAPEPDVMQQPPRGRREPLVTGGMLSRAYIFFGSIEAALVMAAFFWTLTQGGWVWGMSLTDDSPLLRLARTVTFVGIVSTQVGTAFACRTERVSVFRIGLFSNRWLMVGIIFELLLTVAMVYVPPVQQFFGLAPLDAQHWLLVAPFGFIIFGADELRKWLARRTRGSRVGVGGRR